MDYAKVGAKIKSKYPEYNDLSDEQVGKMIVQKYPEYRDLGQSFIERAVDSDALPIIGTILGLGGGAILAPVTMGASLPFGSIAGYGGGKAMQESLQDLLGIQKQVPREQLSEAITGAATAGTIGEAGAMGRALLNPMKAVGEVRSASLGDKTINPETTAMATTKLKTNPYYKYADPDVQKIAEDRLITFLKQFAGPDKTGKMTNVYQEIVPFEKASNAYGSTEQFAKGSELASRAIRGSMSEQSPFIARQATNVMGLLQKSKPIVQKGLPWLAGGGGAIGAVNYLLNKFKQ